MEVIHFNLSSIKFSHAVKYNNGFYINIYDNNFDNVILQTAKLKIGYSCSALNKNSTHKNKSYYYSIYINDELNTFITEFEELCITHLKKIKASLGIKNFTFNSSLNDSNDNMSISLRVKLITDKDASILTLINLHTREPVDISYIKTDNHAVQYIELTGISITNEGQVYPIITAHQIVIFPNYKIYKKKILLDVLLGSNTSVIEAPIKTKNVDSLPAKKPNLFKLDSNMLQNMRDKLKPV